MPDFLYRFRSLGALLSERQELEKQQIFFSSLKQLNDPMEGAKDIFWQGDEIIWTNFIRHYLLCLVQTVAIAFLGGPEFIITDEHNFVRTTPEALPAQKGNDLLERIWEVFFSHPDTGELANILSNRRNPVKRGELISYLRLIHLFALNCVILAMEEQELMPVRLPDDPTLETSGKPIPIRTIVSNLEQIELEYPDDPSRAQALYDAESQTAMQLDLINAYNKISDRVSSAWQTVITKFPERYVNQLEGLVYHDAYVACFVESPLNAAMWGNYADGHSGICLKFKVEINDAGLSSLTLKCVNGWKGKKGLSPEPIRSDVKIKFHKINYQSGFVEIDFFRSLGTLSISTLNFWYYDTLGNTSACAEDIFSNREKWSERYWNNFYVSLSTKLTDWSHENEQRLILHSLVGNLNEPTLRITNFPFENLAGVIFGINTPEDAKLEVMRIIDNKCQESIRSDFEFYQAYYSSYHKSIQLAPLKLITPKPTE